MLIPKPKVVPKKRKYQVVAIVESRRCSIHGAALVSEVKESTNGRLSLSDLRRRKVMHCPFCS